MRTLIERGIVFNVPFYLMLHHKGIILIPLGLWKNRKIETIYTLISVINDLVIVTG